MYEKYTRQALPERHYRELLGTAIYVFNCNNAFIIEIIKKNDVNNKYNWYRMTDLESGKLIKTVHKIISSKYGKEVENLYSKIIEKRNRIIHSFGITAENGEQILATKTKIKEGNQQFRITEEFLLEFIKLNDELSDKIYKIRGY